MNDRAANCRDVKDLVDLYVSEDLEPGQADAVRMHLGRCEPCRAEADAFRRQHEHLAALSSAQMPNQLSPFFWQGIQREILLGDGEAEEVVHTAPRRRLGLRPFLYALAALVLVAVSVYAAATFFRSPAGTSDAPPNEIVRNMPQAAGATISQEVPFIVDGVLAPAGRSETKEIEL